VLPTSHNAYALYQTHPPVNANKDFSSIKVPVLLALIYSLPKVTGLLPFQNVSTAHVAMKQFLIHFFRQGLAVSVKLANFLAQIPRHAPFACVAKLPLLLVPHQTLNVFLDFFYSS